MQKSLGAFLKMGLSAPLRVRALIFFLFLVALTLRHLSGPPLDLAIYIVGGLLTAGFSILGGHLAANKREHRLLIYIMGIALSAIIVTSGIRQYRAAIIAAAAPTPEQIVMTAVDKSNSHTDQAVDGANKHTDTEISMVRDDLKGATNHSDQQINMVRGDLKGAIGTFTELFSKTENDLNASIGKVGKPDPPIPSRLHFSLWSDAASFTNPLLNAALSPDKDDIYTLDFTLFNSPDVAARAVDAWIDICTDGCSFAKEPEEFQKLSGMPEQTRHAELMLLNPGTSWTKHTLNIKVVRGKYVRFQVTFRYSCEACGKMELPQTATVTMLPALP